MSEKGIAIYIRLSLADEGTGKTKDESNSIVNQRSLIHGFLDRHTELSGLPRTEFVDDGYSGTTADRPAFQRMMAQIREGRFSACASKDFSRIFRDYIEMGDCLEYLFPSLDVRYISINDRYDSNDYKGTTGGLDVVMRTIVYDAYSKDLSIKESTGKRQSWKKGRRATGLPAYGYMPDPERKSMDVIDPEAAAVVRCIFDLALSGKSPVAKIAELLNKEGIATPSAYYREKHPDTKKYGYVSDKHHWTVSAVYQILDRYAYTGASVGNLRKQLRPCGKVTKKMDRSDWIIVPGMHEAIVTEEEYDEVQARIHGSEKRVKSSENYPLKTLMVCGSCGRVLTRNKQKQIFRCQYGRNGGDAVCNTIISPKVEEIESAVFSAIRNFISLSDEAKKKRQVAFARGRKTMRTGKETFAFLQKQIESLKKKKLEEYERYCSGLQDKERYLAVRKHLDEEISGFEECASSALEI